MSIVASGTRGPIRWAIDAQGAALALYKNAVRNKMVRNALIFGGRFWVGFFLPKRFQGAYAKVYGYPAVKRRTSINKAKILGQIQPYQGYRAVLDPKKMINAALGGARSGATSTQTRGFIRILVPYGHPIRPEYSQAFRNIPSSEVKMVAENVAQAMAAELAGNPLTDANRKKEPKPRVVGGNGSTRKTGGAPGRAA